MGREQQVMGEGEEVGKEGGKEKKAKGGGCRQLLLVWDDGKFWLENDIRNTVWWSEDSFAIVGTIHFDKAISFLAVQIDWST